MNEKSVIHVPRMMRIWEKCDLRIPTLLMTLLLMEIRYSFDFRSLILTWGSDQRVHYC